MYAYSNENYIHLGLARGITAIMAVSSHLSAFILVELPLVQSPGAGDEIQLTGALQRLE